ncbi:MAG: hypothetical protein ACREI3_00160, partial [Nitrospirales bacterium]
GIPVARPGHVRAGDLTARRGLGHERQAGSYVVAQAPHDGGDTPPAARRRLLSILPTLPTVIA